MKRDKQLICIGVAVIIFSLISIFKTLTVESKTKWYNKQYDEYMQKAREYIDRSDKCTSSSGGTMYATRSLAWSNLAREVRETEGK